MTIQTVIDNLNRTISGKEMLLDTLSATHLAKDICPVIKLNITELEAIRDDLMKVDS